MKKIGILFTLFLLILGLSACSLLKKPNIKSNKEEMGDLLNLDLQEEARASYSQQLKKFDSLQEAQDFLVNNELVSKLAPELETPESLAEINLKSLALYKNYIYLSSYNDLYVLEQETGDEIKAVSKLSFPSRPNYLNVVDKYLIVSGFEEGLDDNPSFAKFARQSKYSFVKIYDLTQAFSPRKIRDLVFEGEIRDWYLKEDNLSFLIDNYISFSTTDSLVPRVIENGRILSNDCEKNIACYNPDFYYFDAPYSDYRLFTVNTLDLENNQINFLAHSFILDPSQSIYLNNDSLYINNLNFLDEEKLELRAYHKLLANNLDEDSKNALRNIEKNLPIIGYKEAAKRQNTLYANYLDSLNSKERAEKEASVNKEIVDFLNENKEWREQSFLFKFIIEKDRLRYRARAEFPGLLLGDAYLSEDKQGNLRLLSLSKNLGQFNSDNKYLYNLYTFSNNLEPLGSLESIALGDNLPSSLFTQNKLYLKSRASDNLLVLFDLSRLTKPALKSSVKVGNLNHLYELVGSDELLLLSKSGDLGSLESELKLQIYALNQDANLDLISQTKLAESKADSLAYYYKDLVYYNELEKILILPARINLSSDENLTYFSGLNIYRKGDSSLELMAQVDHSEGGKFNQVDQYCNFCFNNSVTDILVNNGILYSLSNKQLRLNRLSDFSEIVSIKIIPDTEIEIMQEPLRDTDEEEGEEEAREEEGEELSESEDFNEEELSEFEDFNEEELSEFEDFNEEEPGPEDFNEEELESEEDFDENID